MNQIIDNLINVIKQQAVIINKIYQLCDETTDNMAVIDFQERIKAILNGKA